MHAFKCLLIYFERDTCMHAHISLQYRKSTTAKHIEDLKRVTGINLHKWVCFSS